MSIRPYVFYKQSELDYLKKVLSDRMVAWAKKWLGANSELAVTSVGQFNTKEYVATGAAKYLQIKVSGYTSAILGCSNKCIVAIASCLLNKKLRPLSTNIRQVKVGRLEERLAYKALEDLLLTVASNKSDDNFGEYELADELPGSAGSSFGDLLVSVVFGQHELELILSSQLTENMLSREYKSDSKTSYYDRDLRDLLKIGSVKCEVALGKASVSFEELTSLQVGDVIKLNIGLGEPCDLRFTGASRQVKCVLGKKQGNKAVKLV